jgi:hypothetical protein
VTPHRVADLPDRGQVGLLERGHDLLEAESVVAGERLAPAHVAQLVQHRLSVLMRPLVASTPSSAICEWSERPHCYLPGVEAVIAGKREASLGDWISLRIGGLDG